VNNDVVGVRPWLPGFLGRSPSWTQPIRAERLAAFRIGLAAVLLIDILLTYLPNVDRFFGAGTLGDPSALGRTGSVWSWDSVRWNWSLLRGVESSNVFGVALGTWAVAAGLLLVGLWTRVAAIVTWALAVSIHYVNPGIHNAGDTIRNIGLFYLMLCPCGAVWSIDAWRIRRQCGAPLFVHPWPVQLMLIQLAVIYFFNGLHKLVSPQWQSGEVLYWVLANPMWSRWSYAQLPTPYLAAQLGAWITMIWELLFPLLILRPRSRAVALCIGAAFHVGILVSMELGAFPLYMMCLYLPFAPWERLADIVVIFRSAKALSFAERKTTN
jgi:hypothetical protein